MKTKQNVSYMQHRHTHERNETSRPMDAWDVVQQKQVSGVDPEEDLKREREDGKVTRKNYSKGVENCQLTRTIKNMSRQSNGKKDEETMDTGVKASDEVKEHPNG